MKSDSLWPPPFPFPPTPPQTWSPAAKRYLTDLIRWRLDQGIGYNDISERDVIMLIRKVATPKAVKRFYHVRKYEQETYDRKITYIEWLDRVLTGYASFAETLDRKELTPEGERYLITQTLDGIILRTYFKQYKRYPNEDHRQDLVANLFLAIVENYFYDTEFEPWLWKTARNIILSDGRNAVSSNLDAELDIEIAPGADSGDDWLDLQIQREAILSAIRKIPNRRYRIILLLIYLYDLDNRELATFFGITVPQVTTWKSRARKALREHYTPPHQE